MISVKGAVRSMTSLPAQMLGLRNRGQVREGFVADVIVLDLDRVRDRATFTDPHQHAEGIDYVLVNGSLVVDVGSLTWADLAAAGAEHVARSTDRLLDLPGVVITRREGRAPPTTQ